ncbi:family 16 glycoside hydrolase, partial [Sphingomonas sp.]|uniref:family 16 glycoside hydrolase n=1 Tax=Sphingomonas sp. TaxID=28214 RepID=UPI002EDA152D
MSTVAFFFAVALAQTAPAAKPEETEVWSPEPKIVTPAPAAALPVAAPSDAVVLFDGRDLDEWVSFKDKSSARWTVADGALTVRKGTGNIETRRRF